MWRWRRRRAAKFAELVKPPPQVPTDKKSAEAAIVRAEAAKRTIEGREDRVDEVVAAARRHRQENHFSAMFEEIMKEGRA